MTGKLRESNRLLAVTVAGEAVASLMRGALFIWGPRSTTSGSDYYRLREVDPGFGWYGAIWLAAGVAILALLVAERRRALPVTLVVFGAFQMGWAIAITAGAFHRAPIGDGLDKALNYAALAVGCWLLSLFVEWGYTRAEIRAQLGVKTT